MRASAILAGDDDPIIPAINARIMHGLIQRSELTIYHGGHLDLITEAGRLAPVVEAFLTAETQTPVNGGRIRCPDGAGSATPSSRVPRRDAPRRQAAFPPRRPCG